MIDAHQHFWSVARGDYGWMTPDLGPLRRDFGPEDLAPLMAEAGIDRTVLVQAAETEAETDSLLAVAERTPFVAGVVGWLDMQAQGFADRLSHYRTQPRWLGLRPMLQDHDPAYMRTPAFRAALAEVARRDVPFDVLTHPRHLPAFREALAAAPGLRAVLDHLSKPDMTGDDRAAWEAHVGALALVPTISCKVSGLVTQAGPGWTPDRIRPFLRHAARAFGADRLVFGTDWPVCTLAASHGEVVALARALLGEVFGPEDLQKVFEGNALRFYGIKG